MYSNMIAGLMDGVGNETNLISCTVKSFHVHDSIYVIFQVLSLPPALHSSSEKRG